MNPNSHAGERNFMFGFEKGKNFFDFHRSPNRLNNVIFRIAERRQNSIAGIRFNHPVKVIDNIHDRIEKFIQILFEFLISNISC